MTNGQYKPPKHLLLPNAVKTLTGYVEVIHTLNKLGHGISYSQLEENDTALCLQKMASNNQGPLLPSSIKPYIFTNLAWDNIDRLEETLTGKGTSHRVNGIAVQPKVFGPHLPPIEPPPVEKRCLYLLSTRGWKCIYLGHLLVHILCHQKIPMIGNTLRCSYLPTINTPATELRTVYEIMNQSELIRKELNLETIVVVMDQAPYAKATEIVWKHKDRFSCILLRMGTFHTISNALSILGKRFQDAALWRRSLHPEPGPNPIGHGWKLDGERLVIDWMDGQPAPEAVLDLLACTCTNKCTLPTCVCLSNHMRCTE